MGNSNGKEGLWAALFKNSLASEGMELLYIRLEIKEGIPVAKLKVQELRRMEANWDNTLVIFIPD